MSSPEINDQLASAEILGDPLLLSVGFQNESITTPLSSAISTVKVIVAASVVTSTVFGDATRLLITGGVPSFSLTSVTLTIISCVAELAPSLAVTVAE